MFQGNVGTRPAPDRVGGATRPAGGREAVVVRGRESRLHGEGPQWGAGWPQFLRERLIPYRFDLQHPHYRRYRARNFGHWMDSNRTTAVIVDSLNYYPIRYATRFTQASPYTPEGREQMTARQRAGKLVTVAWREPPPESMNGPKVYGLLQDWLARQGNRCTACGRDLDKVDVQKLLYRLAGRLRNAFKGSVNLLCKTCSASAKH